MVKARKVQVCDRLVGILQHHNEAMTQLLGLTLDRQDEHVFMRPSALTPIFTGVAEAFFRSAFGCRRVSRMGPEDRYSGLYRLDGHRPILAFLMPSIPQPNNVVIHKNRRYHLMHKSDFESQS